MAISTLRLSFFVLAALAPSARADLPVHCLLRDVVGEWDFHVGPPVLSVHDGRDVLPSCGHHLPNTVMSMLDLNFSKEVSQSKGEVLRVNLTEEITSSPYRHLHASFGAKGGEAAWTMVFDEGFEVRQVSGKSFFAHFKFSALPGKESKVSNDDRWGDIAKYVGRNTTHMVVQPQGDIYECHCDSTSVGWWHRHNEQNRLESGCFYATKVIPTNKKSLIRMASAQTTGPQIGKKPVTLASVKKHTATASDIRELGDLMGDRVLSGKQILSSGGEDGLATAPSLQARTAAAAHVQLRKGNRTLPKSWDWREQLKDMHLDDRDGLSEQFNQGNCGSCYAFSGAMVLQMRFRIQLLKKHGILYPLELSWRSATQCSPYTEGCGGGFAYLTFKFAAEAGLPIADCDKAVLPQELDQTCAWGCYRNDTSVFYAKDYGQTGGFAHGAGEDRIMQEIYDNGPVIVSFSTKAAPEFIYNNGQSDTKGTQVMTRFLNERMPSEKTSSNPEILPWFHTTHSILAVGFGEEVAENGETVKYWIIRNSWGTDWGTDGYAKIRRGQNDAALETSAPWVTPDMDRLPAGFLEMASKRHEEHAKALKAQGGSLTHQVKNAAHHVKGGIPDYCKMRPDSPDCS